MVDDMKTTVDLLEKDNGRKIGDVTYDTVTKEISVNGFHPKLKRVKRYLATKRSYRIPRSQRLDDYREDNMFPSEALDYFELALCTLNANVGVWVDWQSQRNG